MLLRSILILSTLFLGSLYCDGDSHLDLNKYRLFVESSRSRYNPPYFEISSFTLENGLEFMQYPEKFYETFYYMGSGLGKGTEVFVHSYLDEFLVYYKDKKGDKRLVGYLFATVDSIKFTPYIIKKETINLKNKRRSSDSILVLELSDGSKWVADSCCKTWENGNHVIISPVYETDYKQWVAFNADEPQSVQVPGEVNPRTGLPRIRYRHDIMKATIEPFYGLEDYKKAHGY